MKRRELLAIAASVPFGGCIGQEEADPGPPEQPPGDCTYKVVVE